MPKSSLSFDSTIHLWEITESLEELNLIPILTDEERVIVDSFRKENRKKEILASRALLQAIIPSAHIHYVNKNPQLTDLDKEISISHSDSKVMIQLKEKNELCGVDIQEITDKAIRVKTKFLHPSEITLMSSHPWDVLLLSNLFWSAKETAYKAFASLCEQEEVIEFKTQLLFNEVDTEACLLQGNFIEKNKRTLFTLGFSVQKDFVATWFNK